MLSGRFVPLLAALAVARLAGQQAGRARRPRHLPDRHADVRRSCSSSRGRDRRRAHLLPRPAPRPDRPGPDHPALLSMRRDLITSALAIVVFTVALRARLPAGHHRHLAGGVPEQGRRQPDRARRQGRRLDADRRRTSSERPRYFQSRPSVTGYNADGTFFNNLGPNQRTCATSSRSNLAAYLKRERPVRPGPDRGATFPSTPSPTSASGVDPHISEANARIQAHRVAEVRRLPLARVNDADRREHRRPPARLPRRARRERARAEPRARPGGAA